MTTAAFAEATTLTGINVTSFSDVTTNDWFYNDVVYAAQHGILSGTTTPVNGVGTFAPNREITRAEFLKVAVYAVSDVSQIPDSPKGTEWWTGVYNYALEEGIIKDAEMARDIMNKPITRQEMSLILVRCLEQKGETATSLVPKERIPDLGTAGTYYQPYIRQAYSMGMLVGNNKGEFKPSDSTTRAQAATVVRRILEPSVRAEVDFSTPTQVDQTQGAITITEYAKTERRLAKAGDTVVKADGTKVVLKVGPNGILGEGQGVAPDAGIQVRLKGVIAWTVEPNGTRFGHDIGKDSTGDSVMNQYYMINNYTGEGHWQKEWQKLTQQPTVKGSFNYELSKDKNWVWLSDMQEWMGLVGQSLSSEGIQLINQANGIK